MKATLLHQGLVAGGVAALLTLLSACATSPTISQSKQAATPVRDSSGPVYYTAVTPSRKIPVEVIYDNPPLDEL